MASGRGEINSRGTHLMHLEAMRFELWSESVRFLLGAGAGSRSLEEPTPCSQ